MKTLKHSVPETLDGARLDKAINALESSLTRSRAQNLLESGHITVNGTNQKPSAKVRFNDEIVITIPPIEKTTLKPIAMPLDIVYEDSELLVVNKPSGLAVHPAPTLKDTPTLVHGLLAHLGEDFEGVGGVERPGIVHRIDKDTSGLLVVAKTTEALYHLQASLKSRKMERIYHALVEGIVAPDKGKVNAPIGRDPKNRQNMTVIEGGRDAITYFDVEARYQNTTLIRCMLESGRTHQIRVHMRYIGHAIVGDEKYGHKKTDTTHGQYLHASTLAFTHPKTKTMMRFEAPLPDFFKQTLTTLKV